MFDKRPHHFSDRLADAPGTRKAWWRLPSTALLAILSLSLLLYPFADSIKVIRTIVQVLDVIGVLMIARLVRNHSVWLQSGWVIAIPTMALQIVHLFDVNGTELPMLVLQVIFHGYGALVLLNYVLADNVVTLDELFALGAIYILLALMWASAYAVVVHFVPGAIFINDSNNLDGVVSFADLVYYSVTTLTSTGYGEITPLHPAARSIAMMQQVVGVMFVSILIARLTSLYRPQECEDEAR